MDDKGEGKKVALALLIGGLIGAGIALLYAPQSGRETRKDITKTAKKMKKRSLEMVDDTIDHIKDFADNVKDITSDIVEQGAELSESAKKEIVSAFEYSQKVLAKQRDRLIDALRIQK
ncbi:MAG: YtxH domain-containing protein [Nitrospirae bacterium]|nr:YtxH domain-containing protein [Nitrospirota bacterium]